MKVNKRVTMNPTNNLKTIAYYIKIFHRNCVAMKHKEPCGIALSEITNMWANQKC